MVLEFGAAWNYAQLPILLLFNSHIKVREGKTTVYPETGLTVNLLFLGLSFRLLCVVCGIKVDWANGQALIVVYNGLLEVLLLAFLCKNRRYEYEQRDR